MIAAPAMAATVDPPTPNTPAISHSNQGTEPPAQSGSTGGQPADLDATVGNGQVVGDGGNNPAIYLASTGGTGGTGEDGGPNYGGAGGTAGAVTLLMSPGSAVVGSGTEAAVISLLSQGGAGNTAGDQGNSNLPGLPGHGGNSNQIQFDQWTSVYSSNPWTSTTPGTTAILMQAIGGNAAQPLGNAQATDTDVTGPNGTNGGDGGTITYFLHSGDVTSAGSAIVALSQGGTGSDGTPAYGLKSVGGNGGNGGNGSDIYIYAGQNGSPTLNIKAIGASSASTGVTIPIDQGGAVAQASLMAAGIQAQSIGGQAGAGAAGDGGDTNSGNGGKAGDAGTVKIGLGSTNITTTGFAAAGVLAQSIGGAGGNGAGAEGMFSHGGGHGGAGGDAQEVSVSTYEYTATEPTSAIKTAGADSMGVVAQSVGGGGGAGGSVQTGSIGIGFAIGGDGEAGGTGGVVSASNGSAARETDPAQSGIVISTKGVHSSGMVAQSIGGGGGTGGSASTTSVGVFSYAVGGKGGDGGSAGSVGTNQVTVYNSGVVSTTGNHAKGVVGQAVGGGGGDGGGAVGQSATNTVNVNVAIGGDGGKGGTAGDVLATNAGQILTSGSDAWGLLGQSVGDGGGNGGMSKSEAYDLATNAELPTVQVSVGVGGTGGDGATGGNVGASNTGLIMTSGANAHGILAQSISGGGGNGGDSSADSTIIGDGTSITIKVDVGGEGGGGGAGGAVTADNSSGSFIFTAGDSARGIFAQSVGGGGGVGATGKADTRFVSQESNSDNAAQLTLVVGGAGGSGAAGGNVTATNEGNLLTLGDNGNGIFAQSVGGGGGVGGAATAKGTGGKHTETITISGSAGSSANGGLVTATNTGNILTYGGDAAAIYAQSVGGGGGKAGSATTAGLPDTVATLSGWLPNSTSLKSSLQSYAGVDALGANAWNAFDSGSLQAIAADYLAYATSQADNLPADSTKGSATAGVNVGGGSGGGDATAGNGGQVDVTNNGALMTNGPMSAGIFAQSVGGGGGDGGTTQVQKLQSTGPEAMTGSVVLGGRAKNTGNGGVVNASNLDGSIVTQGDASFGVFAQSVGGGGGHGSITASGFTSLDGSPSVLTIGGDGTTQGDGGSVTVTNAIDKSGASASISTSGNDAVGIVAQSIGGGGGDVVVLHTKANANGNGHSVGASDPTLDSKGALTDIQIGGTTPPPQGSALCPNVGDGYAFAGCGKGGNVAVTTNDANTTTQGRNAHGVLAQSLGGGGGWITGISYGGSTPFASKPNDNDGIDYANMGGNGGDVTLNVNSDIVTYGPGAYAILAQSVGGGGVLGGDLGSGGSPVAFPLQNGNELGAAELRWGNGGAINISVNGNQVLTKGDNSPAIFAQSVGGGGGLMASTHGMMMGTAGGTGYAGSIDIANNGGFIQASGNGSSAIYVNSEGHDDSGSKSDVNVQNSGTIYGVTNTPVIVLSGQHNTNGNGQVNNSGTIAAVNTGNNQPAPGTAISVGDVDPKEQPYIVVNNQAGGKIYGDINAGAAGTISNAGYWAPNSSSTADNINNTGTIAFNAMGQDPLAAVTFNGVLNDNGGTLVMPASFEPGSPAPVVQLGGASLQGTTIVVQPTRLLPVETPLISGPVGYPSVTVQDTGNYLFSYSVDFDPAEGLAATPASRLVSQAEAAGMTSNLLQTATNLENNFTANAGDTMAQTYANLSTIDTVAGYLAALINTSSESVQAASAAHLSASQAFVERMNSCPQFDGQDTTLREQDCGWVRVVANQADHDATSSSVGFRQNGQTVQAGGQREVATDWFVGGSVAYDQSDLDSHAVDGSIDGQGWSAGVVVKHQMGDWLVSGALDGGRMSYDGDRHLLFTGVDRHATSQFDVSHWGLHSRIARQIPFADWYLKPYVDLHATRLESSSYTEKGAGELSLQVASSNENVFSAAPMLEAGGRFDFASGKQLRLFGGVGAAFYSDDTVGADMRFAQGDPGAGTFHIDTDLPDQRVKANAGLDLKASDHLDLRLEYNGEFASHYEDNSGTLKLSYVF